MRLAVALVALVASASAGPALAQTSSTTTTPPWMGTTTTLAPTIDPSPTTSPPSTSSTAAPPSTSTQPGPSTTLPGASGGAPAPPPAPQPVDAKVEIGSEEPPPRLAVPPRTTPRVVTPVDQAVAKVLEEQLKAAQLTANGTLAASQAADRTLAVLEGQQADLQRSFEALHVDEAAAAARLLSQRKHMRTRAVAIYVSGPGEPTIPAGLDIHEFGRRRVLVQALHAADRRSLDGYLQAKDVAGEEVDAIINRLEDLNGKVLAARAESELRAAATQNGFRSVGAAQVGGRLAISGFAFPVAEPHNFVDTFGAPRSGGRLHQGNDIFAPYGTPLYASERGVVANMGTNSLGGIKLWLNGESGTSYYYAHLSAFALNVVDGTLVEPGDVVGFVGNTGNAITTPPHLHFEIHPGGGPAIDPYTILKAADDATKQVISQQPVAPAPAPALPGAAPLKPPAAVP